MDGAASTDSTQAVTVATPTPDKMTESVSLVQTGARTCAMPPGRRRRASMQDALDHTKINTSLYDPRLVRLRVLHTILDRQIQIMSHLEQCRNSPQLYSNFCLIVSVAYKFRTLFSV